MDADTTPKIFRPRSNVLQHQFIDVGTSAAEQPKDISCSVVPRTMDFPIPIHLPQTGADGVPFFATGSSRESRESDELLNDRHFAPLAQ